MFFMRDSNRWMGDSNRWLSTSLLSSHGIWIVWLRIQSNWSTSIFLLKFGFESLHEGFESPLSIWTFWNMDSNRYMRDSNHFFQSKLSGMWIRIAIWGIRIAFFEFAWKAPKLRVNWGIRIALLGIRIWPLENSSKCSFVKIFLGIFIYILKHSLNLISKHNMSVLVSSKSTRVQQSPLF